MSYENLQDALRKKISNEDLNLSMYVTSPRIRPESKEFVLEKAKHMNLGRDQKVPNKYLSNHKSPKQQHYDESFACKSVEIIHTKTVMSRNNTHVEVYQYQHDETLMNSQFNNNNGAIIANNND